MTTWQRWKRVLATSWYLYALLALFELLAWRFTSPHDGFYWVDAAICVIFGIAAAIGAYVRWRGGHLK